MVCRHKVCPRLTVCLMGLLLMLCPFAFGQTPVVVMMRDGSVLRLEASTPSILWQTIDENVKTIQGTPRSIPLDQIESLSFSNSSIGQQLATLESLIEDLGAPGYADREAAEARLRANASLNVFRGMVERYQNHPSFELRYRLSRILNDLATSGNTTEAGAPPEELYDLLALADGTRLTGDAQAIPLEGSWRGIPLSIPQEKIRGLQIVSDSAAGWPWSEPRGNEEAEYQLLIKEPAAPAWQRGRLIDFETTPSGMPLEGYASINQVYVPEGVRFSSEEKFNLIISGFKFSFETPPRNNSICVLDLNAGYAKRFEGVTRIQFCLPGAAQYAAGVRRVGFYAARIDNVKDFVMKAFDAEGNLVGMVEASGEPCPYFGIESPVPIALIEFRNNPYFIPSRWEKDSRYAIDDFRFSAPVPVSAAWNASKQTHVYLNNGELLCAENVVFADDGLLTVDLPFVEASQSIALADVRAVVAAEVDFPKTRPGSNEWLALLTDGSRLKINPGTTFRAGDWGDWELPADQVVAVWPDRDHLRYPPPGDFAEGKFVLSFPNGRLRVPQLDWQDEQVVWDRQAAEVFEQDYAGNLPKTAELEREDALPTFSQWRYRGSQETQSPTFWLRRPTEEDSFRPGVTLRSGERFVTGDNGNFRVERIDTEGVTLVGPEGVRRAFSHVEVARIVW